MKKISLVLLCLLMAAGCARRTSVPQNQMVWIREDVPCVLTGMPEDTQRRVLAETIKALRSGDISAVIAAGPDADPRSPERVRATLTALQVAPQRIVLTPSTGDYLGVTFTVQRLVQARVWESFWDPYWFNRNAVDPEFGRAMEANLGRQYVEKRQLDVPESLSDPNPVAAVGAVDRYQGGKVRGLSDQSVEVGTSGQ